jgi:hypothetical protein
MYRQLQKETRSDFRAYFFPLMNWDRSKDARREIARGLMNSKWRPRDIALAAARAGDVERILANIDMLDTGSVAISSIARDVDSIPEPWRSQVQNAVKNLRRDSHRRKLPSNL